MWRLSCSRAIFKKYSLEDAKMYVGILKLCISESAWTRQESIVGYYENKEV